MVHSRIVTQAWGEGSSLAFSEMLDTPPKRVAILALRKASLPDLLPLAQERHPDDRKKREIWINTANRENVALQGAKP